MTRSSPPNRLPTGQLLAILMVTQTFGWGTGLALLGVLAAPIRADLGLSAAMVYGAATVLHATGALTAPFVGRMVDRFGGPPVLMLGALPAAASLALLGAAQSAAGYFLAWALGGFAMHFALATAAYGTLAQQAGPDGRRAIAILTLATGLCATVMWPVTELLLPRLGWRGVCFLYSGLTLGVSLPAHGWILWRSGPRRCSPELVAESAPHVLPHATRRAFALVATIHTLGAAVGTTLALLMIDLFVAMGSQRPDAVFAASLLGLSYLASRGLEVVMGPRKPPVVLALAVFSLLPISLLPLILWPLTGQPLPLWLAATSAVLYGLPAGLLGILRPTLPYHLFGSARFGSYLGRLSRPMDIANAFAPALFAALLPVSAVAVLLLAVVLCLVALLAAVQLRQLVSRSPLAG